MSPSKTLPRILSSSLQTGGNNPFSPKKMLFENLFFPTESGKDYEAEKMTKIKLATGSDESQHLCNLFIFVLCFVVP